MNIINNSKDAVSNSSINKNVKINRYLFLAGISFAIYSIIEISDCIYLFLIIINIAPNLYLSMGINIPEIQHILLNQPIFFLPFFIGIVSLILTIIMDLLFIPFGFIEMCFCIIILILLIIGYFGKTPIV
ncbi:MAG: hypothetical protein P8Y23_18215 [Candidatus Lokiarchaeota archaeon]